MRLTLSSLESTPTSLLFRLKSMCTRPVAMSTIGAGLPIVTCLDLLDSLCTTVSPLHVCPAHPSGCEFKA